MKYEIDIIGLLNLLDRKNAPYKKHISSLNGLIGEDLGAGLFKHYLENENWEVTVFDDNPKEDVEEGKSKKEAKQLDRWIKAVNTNQVVFYKTEIKNWTASSFKKYNLEIDSPLELILQEARSNFSTQWDSSRGMFWENITWVSKVLKKMKKHSTFQEGNKTLPLVCYWYPIAREDCTILTPFFPLNYIGEEDGKVYIFSMSIYLRTLLHSNILKIEIEVPNIYVRLNQLEELFRKV